MKSTHLPDSELLLYQSGELSSRAADTVQKHFVGCEECRVRFAKLEAILSEVRNSNAVGGELPETRQSVPRSKLIAEMKRSDAQDSLLARSFDWRDNFLYSVLRPLAFTCIAVLGIMLVGRTIPAFGPLSSRSLLGPWQPSALPSKTLTPGVTKAVALSDLCSVQASTARVPIDDSTARKVFQEYGLPFALRGNYEVDYLITPGLGGSSDIRNLWPEPDESTKWNAHVKDVLEDHLHDLVCEGKMPLATAQNEIAEDWIAAYRKHFHTDGPLQGSVSSRARMTGLHPLRRVETAERRRRG